MSALRVSGLTFLLLLGAAPARVWVWVDQDSSVLPSLQEEFDQEVSTYRAQSEKGMSVQERLIALDRLVGAYKPQGINTVVLESERDRLIIQSDKERTRAESSQKLSSELFQLSLQKTKEGRFEEALRAIERAERLVPADKSIYEMRRKLEGVTAIMPGVAGKAKADYLVRKAVLRFLENDGEKSLNALRYAGQISNLEAAVVRLTKMIEGEFPNTAPPPPLSPGNTIVDYKLQLALEHVYEAKYLQAINVCNEVLDLEPNNVLALTRLGSAYFAMGQKNKARDIWRRALKIDPQNTVLKKFMAEKFRSAGAAQ